MTNKVKPQKILIVGISGTGKTHLANKLGEITGLPVINLDSIFWKPNWEEEAEDVVEAKISNCIKQDKWIIEGYVEPLAKERVAAADEVIYLDYSGFAAARGGFMRALKHRKTPRPEMPAGNTDGFGYKFFKSLIARQERPEIERAIVGSEDKVVRLKNRRVAQQFTTEFTRGNNIDQ